MSRFLKFGLALIGCLCFAVTAFGQSQTFIVDDDAGGNTYPTLAGAIATAVTFTGTHTIIVNAHSANAPGWYTDANLTLPGGPGIIGEIKGAGGDVVFKGTAPNDFLSMWPGLKVNGLKIQGYRYALLALGISGCVVTDNCFIGNGIGVTSQAYDNTGGNAWEHNFWSDYADVTFPFASYGLDGGGEADNAVWLSENNPVGVPASVEVDSVFAVNFDFSMSSCNSAGTLGGYDFAASWDPTKLELVPGSFSYDPGYLGPLDGSTGALYTSIDPTPAGTLRFAATNLTNPGTGNGRLAFASFKALVTGAASITLGSQYVDGNGAAIGVRDGAAGTLVVDTEKPVVTSVTINGGGTYSDYVPLTFDATVTDNYCLYTVRYRVDGGAESADNFVSGTSDAVTGVAVSLAGLLDGLHTLHVIVYDCADGGYLVSDDFDSPFNVDKTGPVLTSIVLKDADGCAIDPNFTNSPTVKVDLTDDGTGVTMQIYDADAPVWQPAIPYANPDTYTMANTADGSKHIYYRLIDLYGNIGNQIDDFITLDQGVPSAVSLTLAGGAAKTNNPTVSFSVPSWGVGFVEYNISENSADFVCGNPGWKPTFPGPWNVTLSEPDGMKTVYLAVRDEAGNISVSPWVSDGIELDRAAPGIVSFSVDDANGDQCSDSWTVNVTVAWSAADVAEVHVGQTLGGPYPTVVSLVGQVSPYTFAYTIAAGTCDAMNTIYGVLVDDIGNQGAEASDGIFVDCFAPTLASVVIADAAAGGAPLANPDWTNSLSVNLNLTGLALDVTHLIISEDAGFTAPDTVPVANPFLYTYQGTPTECAATGIWVKSMDCAGRTSPVQMDNIWFDLTAPVFSAFSGPALTNTLAISLSLTATDNDGCGPSPFQMQLSEDAAFTGASWVPYSAAPAFTLAAGPDGDRHVYARVADVGGTIGVPASKDILVKLDMTAPGLISATLRQIPASNPSAMAGYTNSLVSDEVVSIVADVDAVDMALRNDDGSNNTGWILLASSHSPLLSLIPGADGIRTVQIIFRDGAGNVGSWANLNINYDTSPPSAPAAAAGGPGGSIVLNWSHAAQAASYILRYNFSGDYPQYVLNNPPPFPATQLQGILIDNAVADTFTTFAPVAPSVYAISIWSRDSAGNVSTSPLSAVRSTNYILGDFKDASHALGQDGCLDFVDEFGDMAIAYNTAEPNPLFNPYLDIAGGVYNTNNNYPLPNNAIDFDDLVRFAINYDAHHCGGFSASPTNTSTAPLAKAAFGPVAFTVKAPSWLTAQTEYTVSVMADNAAVIKGYHVVLAYNADAVELLSVSAGASYSQVEKSFFYYDPKSPQIDVSGVVLGADAAFDDGELFRITLRARSSGDLRMEDVQMIVRDRDDKNVEASFGIERLATSAPLPTSFALGQNYPNPFNAGTVIPVSLKNATDWNLTIYNVAGQVVRTFSGHDEAGVVMVKWDGTVENGSSVASGMYFYRLRAADFVATKKMVLVK